MTTEAQAPAAPAPQSFESIVAEAASKIDFKEAPEAAPMTQEEESIPAESLSEEPAKEPAKEPEKPAEPVQTVPLAVHIRQREKFEREQAEMRRTLELGNQRLAQLAQTIQQQTAPPPVDPRTDPLGALMQDVNRVSAEVQETKEMIAQREQTERVQRDVQQFKMRVIQDEQVFQTEVPDLPDAIAYAKDVKFREYVALGLDPHTAAARVQQDAFALAQHAFQNGHSPSELAYRMAHALGYQRAAPKQEAAPTKSAADTAVEMRAAGSQRSKAAGGAPSSSGPISMEELARLDNDEFAKMTSGKKWEKLFRGA